MSGDDGNNGSDGSMNNGGELPRVAAIEPVKVTLQPGTYWWCACGRSSDQPWCDGSHRDGSFEPKELVIEKERTVKLCTCKRSAAMPYCDNTHEKLTQADIG